MKLALFLLVTAAFIYLPVYLTAQKPERDKGIFIEEKHEFWDSIQKSTDDFIKKPQNPKKTYKMDFTGRLLPKSKDEFKIQWFNEPISQGFTGTCWCFSTTSFLESEINRIYGKKLKISRIFTVYWEYVEKARRFVIERGNSEFGEGSEGNALMRIWKKYGCVPESAYSGMKPGQTFHDHRKMFGEMSDYLNSLRKSSQWNEDIAIETIKSILNHYLGEPPVQFESEGKMTTPMEYLQNTVRLDMDDYVEIMSLKEKPYWEKVEYEVPDNWWKNADYFNIPLEEFMNALKKAMKAGYTLAIGGDVSEPGYDSHSKVALIPTFDIPSDYIDENARQFRFSNKTTTDDHGIHIVGYKETDGKFWFLIKDSGSGSFNLDDKGFYFYSEDYIKLKIMNITIHRSAVEDILKKFK